MSKSNAELGRAAKIRRIDELSDTMYKHLLAKAASTCTAVGDVHQKYIDELKKKIDAATREVGGEDSGDTVTNGVRGEGGGSGDWSSLANIDQVFFS